MDHLRGLEDDMRVELADDSLKYEHDVAGGIVNRAALFKSGKNGESFFVKYNSQQVARTMFESERSSLQLLADTGCVSVPASVKVFQCSNSRGVVHVLEYIPGLRSLTDYWAEFGQQMGRLHMYNKELLQKVKNQETSVHQHSDTTCLTAVHKFGSNFQHFIGTFTPGQVWRNTWQELFIADIMNPLITGVVEKYGDRELQEKWAWLKLHLHKAFEGVPITPTINHGDLCVANFGQTDKGPVLFDPSVQYAHSQFDLLLSHMEETFDDRFFEEYHKIIPKDASWDRVMLVYKLFYHIVMWYHVDEDKFRAGAHSSADQVTEILQKEFGVK